MMQQFNHDIKKYLMDFIPNGMLWFEQTLVVPSDCLQRLYCQLMTKSQLLAWHAHLAYQH